MNLDHYKIYYFNMLERFGGGSNIERITGAEAIEKADQTMFENGIVAVGDICNTTLSKETKELISKSKLC